MKKIMLECDGCGKAEIRHVGTADASYCPKGWIIVQERNDGPPTSSGGEYGTVLEKIYCKDCKKH